MTIPTTMTMSLHWDHPTEMMGAPDLCVTIFYYGMLLPVVLDRLFQGCNVLP
jgi:hypothetical protein